MKTKWDKWHRLYINDEPSYKISNYKKAWVFKYACYKKTGPNK